MVYRVGDVVFNKQNKSLDRVEDDTLEVEMLYGVRQSDLLDILGFQSPGSKEESFTVPNEQSRGQIKRNGWVPQIYSVCRLHTLTPDAFFVVIPPIGNPFAVPRSLFKKRPGPRKMVSYREEEEYNREGLVIGQQTRDCTRDQSQTFLHFLVFRHIYIYISHLRKIPPSDENVYSVW